MKQEMQSPTAEIDGEVISEEDRVISAYIEGLTLGIDEIEKLASRIQKDGLARMSIHDFYEPLYLLGRECFVDWINDLEEIYGWATRKYQTEYFNLRTRYACNVAKLTRAIKDCLPDSQQAQQLAAAIDRLYAEVRGAIERGASQYLLGKGKPQPEDLLSDTRHVALWDTVENAIVALSTAQAETPLSKADICAAIFDAADKTQSKIAEGIKTVCAEVRRQTRKSDGKKTREMQRERAADWLIRENEAGREASIVDAARHFGNEIQNQNIKGGYEDVASILTALYRNAEKLNIAEYKDTDRGRPRKK